MAKFNSLKDVQKAFKVRSNGSDTLNSHAGVRYSDLEKHGHIIERLLETDYNKVAGYSFSEIMEAVSLVATNYNSAEYANAMKQGPNAIQVSESMASTESEYYTMNEAFEGTTISQAPFPVPAVSLVTYQYEKSVIPFLCHQFDLKGNRGLVYYQNIKATNSKGNVTAGDLLGSPKEMGVQNIGFVGTKAVNVEIGTTVSAQKEYTSLTALGKVQPGSVVITLEGSDGYFMDVATADARKAGEVGMLSVNGNLGAATIDYSTGAVKITLAEDPTSAGLKFRATFNRDIEATASNLATIDVSLESKQLVAENFSVFTETNLYQEALSRAVFGLDWNSIVDEALAALYNKEIANKITSEIREKILPTSIATHDISKGIVATSGALGGNNALFNTQFIAVVLGKLKKLIQVASGLALTKLSAIVIHADVLPIMEALPKYQAAEIAFEETMGGMVLVGLYDGIPVIVGYGETVDNTLKGVLAEGEVIGIYKSKTRDFLTPYVFGTFVLPVIRDIFDQDDLSTNRKQLIASAAGEVVAERLAAKITITGIDDVI